MNAANSSGSSKTSKEHEVLRKSEERFRLLVEGVQDYAIFLLDPDGYVISWNAGAERIKGYKADEIIGHHFSEFYPQDVIDSGWPEYELKMAQAEGRFEDEAWRLRKDGSRFWANVVITPLYDSQGEVWGFSKITRDLTERRNHEEALRQSEERFRLLVEGVKDYAIFMLDPDGYVSSWNAGAQEIKGYSAQEIIGQHFSVFYPQDVIDSGWPEYELKMARAEGRFEDEGWRLRKDGSRFWANVIITPLYTPDGELRGFTKVTRDMTQRKRIEALELAERRMTEFLAMLSHELRNPLTPIRNAVYLMQILQIDDPDLKWARDVIDRQVSQMTRLIDDLLEVSRVTNGNIRLQKVRVEIADLIMRAVESSRPLIDVHRHQLELNIPDAPLVVDGDMARLTQVMVNLLNNAAKYTPEGGKIFLTVEDHHTKVVIRVRDTGTGIATDFLKKIFDLFTQGERTLDRSEGGLGIGLTLVRQLVEMHHGTVEAFSPGLGKGSEFVVELPLAVGTQTGGEADAGATGTTATKGANLRVLVVDDKADVVTSMSIFLKTWGYDVRTASDGPGALEIAATYRPQVVLLDIGLPGINGYEVAMRLRKLPGGETMTLIAMTGYGQAEDRRRSEEAGITHHFVKPMDPVLLRQMLSSIAASS